MKGHKAIRYLPLGVGVVFCFVLLPQLWLAWQSNLVLVRVMPFLRGVPPLSGNELLANAQPARNQITVSVKNGEVLMDWSEIESRLPLVKSPRTRATAYLLLGQPEAAATALAEADDNLQTRLLLAFAYTQRGQFDCVPDALRLVPGAGTYLMRASTREQARGNYLESMELLKMAESVGRPEEVRLPELYRILSLNSYYFLNDLDKAVGWAQRWVTVTDADASAVEWLAHLYMQRGQPEAAYEIWQRVNPAIAGQFVSYWKDMGQVYQSRGDWDLAVEMYRAAWQRDQDNPSGIRDYIAWYLGAALVQTGKANESVSYLQVAASSEDTALRQGAVQLLMELSATRP